MTFEDVLNDIESLKGRTLTRIARGDDVIVRSVDRSLERIELETSSGRRTNRSFSEMKTVWEELCTKPAVHVDSALAGSGSSRNQPETIFANLPYVEYLYIDSRKHIALMSGTTHEPGTLRQVDLIQSEKIRTALRNQDERQPPPSAVIVFSDIKQGALELERGFGLKADAVMGTPGVYKLYKGGHRILALEQRRLRTGVPPGCFAVVFTKSPRGESIGIEVDGYELLKPADSSLPVLFARPLS